MTLFLGILFSCFSLVFPQQEEESFSCTKEDNMPCFVHRLEQRLSKSQNRIGEQGNFCVDEFSEKDQEEVETILEVANLIETLTPQSQSSGELTQLAKQVSYFECYSNDNQDCRLEIPIHQTSGLAKLHISEEPKAYSRNIPMITFCARQYLGLRNPDTPYDMAKWFVDLLYKGYTVPSETMRKATGR